MKEKLDNAHSILHTLFNEDLEYEYDVVQLFLEEIEQAINHIKSAKEYLKEIES